jgi:hypothetical protein
MGFWDNNPASKYSQGGDFLKPEEVETLMDSGTVLEITGVREADGKFGKTHQVTLNIEGESRTKSFTQGSVQGRDDMLNDMLAYFQDNGAEPVKVRFVSWGQAVGIEPA